AVQIEDLSWDGDVPCHELSSRKGSEHARRDIRIALERIRRDMDHARRDLASASKTWVDSTSKFVQDKAPKVSATIDETLAKTLPSGWRITTRSQIVRSAIMHSTPMIGIENCSLLSDASLLFLQNGLMLMLPGVLNGRKTAFSLFLREIRLRPTITYAISAPKLYNSATKLSSPERAS